MPEGHTIHRLALDLARDLEGHEIRCESRQQRFAAGAARLDGRVLAGTSALGKHLFLHWSVSGGPSADVLHVHLGLFGRFVRRELPAPEPSDALRLRLTGPGAAWDLTGAIICDIRPPDVIDEVAARLGPDPLDPRADAGRFVEKVLRSRKPVGALLLDQSVIAGIGNVYRAEILHIDGVHPQLEGRSLSVDEVRSLWQTAVEQLRLGVERDRIVTVPLAGRSLASIDREDSFHVYRQERCRSCGGPIHTEEVGGRVSYACPTCQPLEPAPQRQARSR